MKPFRILLLAVVSFGLIVAPAIAQSDAESEGEEEEEQVTISWGQDEEESSSRAAAILDNLPGRGEQQQESATVQSLGLNPYEFSAGLLYGVVTDIPDETTTTTEEEETNMSLAITGKAFYTLNSPLIGDEFRAGRGQQVGAMLQLSGNESARAIYAMFASRRNDRIAAVQYGIGRPFQGGFALAFGAQYASGLVLDTAILVGPETSYVASLIGAGWAF